MKPQEAHTSLDTHLWQKNTCKTITHHGTNPPNLLLLLLKHDKVKTEIEQGWQQIDSIIETSLFWLSRILAIRFHHLTNLKLWVTSGNSHLTASMAWQGACQCRVRLPQEQASRLEPHDSAVVSRNIKRNITFIQS